MAIKRITISNFKSFDKLNIELGKFNILIGANASGKSNFLQIFAFLRDITNHGLDNAISMQGGIAYLRNINIGSSENFSFEVVSDQEYPAILAKWKDKEFIGIKVSETNYKFTINFKKKGFGFDIVEDRLIQKGEFFIIKLPFLRDEKKETLGTGEIIFSKINGKVDVKLNPPTGVEIKKEDMFPLFLGERKVKPKTILLENKSVMPPLFGKISIYDFDPKLPKKATPITGKIELEEDGNNLAIVLKNIIENREKKRKFSNLLRDLLPFVDKLDVEKIADKSLLFKLREIYARKSFLPAPFISDGTINITAIIVALYFEQRPVTIIEEPERNIHPSLISRVVNMLHDASNKKQIIVTTHNPEIIKYANLEDILLIARDKKGFSTISRPAQREEVKVFLKNEIGIEDLYVQNLLEVQ